jgi:hypothetical protein
MTENATDPNVDMLRSLDQEIEDVSLAGDEERMKILISADFIHTHSNGARETREGWIARNRDPKSAVRGRKVLENEVELHGQLAVTTGLIEMTPLEGRARRYTYLRVYSRRAWGWTMVSNRVVQLLPQSD